MRIFTKFGGLLVATIGIQPMLNGIVKFFGWDERAAPVRARAHL